MRDFRSLLWHAGSLAAACKIYFPDQGLNPGPCIGSQSLSHWTTRKVPYYSISLATLPQEFWEVIQKESHPGCRDFPSPEDPPDPGIEPKSLMSPALASGFFTTSATWKVHNDIYPGIIVCRVIFAALKILCALHFHLLPLTPGGH
ncbi:unnamed protein product [Rangifer tarandus platyrhynchus]|uniref:Uncharacterized protein n=1 Tax=Rangifer tarandus platyrhynchus TaxID=3082113 RepID=A0AC59Y9D1_RANTA